MTLLIDWLQQRYPTAKRQTLKRMVEAGRVTINDRPARKLREELRDDEAVRVRDRPSAARPVKLLFGIVHEDQDLIVIDKPAGLLTSTVPRERRPTAIAALREYARGRSPGARVGVIHRLDREASGLLVFSKNHAAYEALKGQFFHRMARRIYLAAVEGLPEPRSGRIESSLVERADGSVHSTRQPGKGQRAITEYQVLAVDGARALVRLTLQTGRKHQIRAHLSERGTPIVGDALYGAKSPARRLMLAAIELEFDHPRSGERVRFELPAPKEIGACVGSGR